MTKFLRQKVERKDRLPTAVFLGFPGGSAGKESACNEGALGSICGGKNPWRRAWQTTPVLLLGKIYEQRILADYDPRGREE